MKTNELRNQFPALSQKIRGAEIAYLDSGATSLKPKAVIDRLTQFYSFETANVHRGAHHLSERTTEYFELGRRTVAEFLNANDMREVLFTAGTTDSINLLATTFGSGFILPGDEILLTEMEHHSNIVPWQLVAEKVGAVVRFAPVTESGELDLAQFSSLISTKTKVVSLTHCSNVLGTVNDVQKICQIVKAKSPNIRVVVDAAQSVTFMPLDVQNLGCDFLTFSAHKLYGPYGIGVLWGRLALLNKMPPYRGGGSMIERVTTSGSTYLDAPHRFEAGTPNISGVIGLKAAVDFVRATGFSHIQSNDRQLLEMSEAAVSKIPGARIIGQSATKVNLFSFVIDGLHGADLGQLLDQQGVAVRTGHHCAQPLMSRYAISGTVRVSFGLYNNESDVQQFDGALTKAVEMLR